MNTILIGAATSSTSSSAIPCWAAGGDLAAAGQRLRRAVSHGNDALTHQLEEFVLELLAVIVLIALFMIVTEPETWEKQS
jgi:hypothetical protein